MQDEQVKVDPSALSDGALLLKLYTPPPGGTVNLRALERLVRQHFIEWALRQAKGSRTHAAQLLGLRRTTLVMRLPKLGLAAKGQKFNGE